MTMLEELNDYDWEEAFRYAEGEWLHPLTGPIGHGVADVPFTREDVAEIFQVDAGCHDEASWIILGKLKSGLCFFLTAWCDYTGWDCQSGGSAYVSDDIATLIRWGLTKEDRERFGLPDPGDLGAAA